MKIISWNVNGIQAAWNHGLSKFLDTYKADIYAFQETKVTNPVRMMEREGYYAYWSFCEEPKGHYGTMCLTRRKPLNVKYDLGRSYFYTEGRIITLEFEDFFFVNCYVPSSLLSEKRSDYRKSWDFYFFQYLIHLRSQKSTIICGDFNVTLSPMDMYIKNEYEEFNVKGFISMKREYLMDIIQNGFVDTFRYLHPYEDKKYTWWSYRKYRREDNQGIRLDYALVSELLKEYIRESDMLTNVFGSDHCPILLDLDIPFGSPMDECTTVKLPSLCTYKELLKTEKNLPMKHLMNSDLTDLWESIDWLQAEKNLESMQWGLAKAAYTRDPGLIASWQKRIVRSLDAKLLAVRHTCSTAAGTGVDRIAWNTPHEKMQAALSMYAKGYTAMPSRLLLLTCKNDKQRRIHVNTYFDRAMQCLYAYALDPVAESWGERKSFAYRKGRSAYDLNEYIKNALSGEDAPSWIFIGDVRKCYENISHDWIRDNIPMSKMILNQFLEAGYVFGGEMFPTDMGIGIGCSLSPIIANMTLDGLQEHIYSRLYPPGSTIDYRDGSLIRYADDIIVVARTEKTAWKIQQYIEEFLDERGLQLSPQKSRIIHIDDEFTFMSRTYFKRGTQVFSRPSDEAREHFMMDMKEIIGKHQGSQESLIRKINHKIDGWVTYHKVSEADNVFRQMDVYINALLLELCEAKYPQWSREKIVKKFWYSCGKERHCYALPNKKEVRVKFLADTLLINYCPVKTNVNPYIDLSYLEYRSKEKHILSASGEFRSIWNRQGGCCHYCGMPILRDDEKSLIEAHPHQNSFVARMAYVHKRCLFCSFDEAETEFLPSSVNQVMEILERLDAGNRRKEEKYSGLSEFFRTCDKKTVTLTFRQMEDLLCDRLGEAALREGFWYDSENGDICQCWLQHGYEVKSLHLDNRLRVTFALVSKRKNTVSYIVPEFLLQGRIPIEARYELDNYHKYIKKKYGL